MVQGKKIRLHSPATQLLHVTANALFHAFSDPAITIPGQAKVIKQLTKVFVIHKLVSVHKRPFFAISESTYTRGHDQIK
jgi:hypothetical protein